MYRVDQVKGSLKIWNNKKVLHMNMRRTFSNFGLFKYASWGCHTVSYSQEDLGHYNSVISYYKS